MITLLPVLCLLQSAPPYQLSYRAGAFVVRRNGSAEIIPIEIPKPKPLNHVAFNRHGRWAVWDKRGLTVRDGKFTLTTRFEAVTSSPRFFTADEIWSNLALIRSGRRKRQATSLAGFQLVKDQAYFLVRWMEPQVGPWLEVLVRVDLTTKRPEAKAVERLEGTSFAEGFIDDRLIPLGDHLAVVAKSQSRWGLALFRPSTQASAFVPEGENLHGYKMLGQTEIAFAETTRAGSKRVGLLDLTTRKSREILESRDFDHLLPGRPLVAQMNSPRRRALRTIGSGAELILDQGNSVWRSQSGVIVGNSTHALLYDPADWRPLARWDAKPPSATR